MADLIVQSRIRDQLDWMSISADFYDAPDKVLAHLVDDASRREEAIDRKTVQARNL